MLCGVTTRSAVEGPFWCTMTVREAPLARGIIDELLPWLRALLGILFVGYSANSTIFIGADDLRWLFESTKQTTIGYFPDAYWYSAFVAVLLFVGEVACGERYRRTYWLFLIPDAFYTARGMFAGLSKAFGILLTSWIDDQAVAGVVGVILAVPAAGVIGYFVAKWGEVLLFGKRRKIRGAVVKKET